MTGYLTNDLYLLSHALAMWCKMAWLAAQASIMLCCNLIETLQKNIGFFLSSNCPSSSRVVVPA